MSARWPRATPPGMVKGLPFGKPPSPVISRPSRDQRRAGNDRVAASCVAHDRPMKIALIRREFSAISGAELYLQRLLGALVRAGNQVHLFAESWKETPAGVETHFLPVSGSRAKQPV